MARINIEDELHRDGRFIKLCIKLGSRRTALGALIEAWIYAQDFAGPENPRALFPFEEFEKHDLAREIIEVGLARVEQGSVYMIGAEEQFKWLLQRREAASKGGKAKAAKRLEGVPVAKRPLSSRLADVCPLTLSLTQEDSGSLVPKEPPSRGKKPPSGPFEVTKENFTESLGHLWADWEDLYGSEYLNREIAKALIWTKNHPKKARRTLRGWGQFFSGWFDRNWDRHARNQDSGKPTEGPDWRKYGAFVHANVIQCGTGTDGREELESRLGPVLHRIAVKANIQRMRELKRDAFTAKNAGDMLRDAAEVMKLEMRSLPSLRDVKEPPALAAGRTFDGSEGDCGGVDF